MFYFSEEIRKNLEMRSRQMHQWYLVNILGFTPETASSYDYDTVDPNEDNYYDELDDNY